MTELKKKKIIVNKGNKIIDLFYIENDFYYSIIYHPNEPWWEPINNSSSLEPVHHSSIKIEEKGVILDPRTSLQAVRNSNYSCINENMNKSEFKNLKKVTESTII